MLAPPYLGALLPLVSTIHTEAWCQTTGDNFPKETAVFGVFQRVFYAPLGETVSQVYFQSAGTAVWSKATLTL